MSTPPAVAVGALLEPDPDAGELVVEIVAGRHGLERLVHSPHVQKTGLALAELITGGAAKVVDLADFDPARRA